MAKSKASKTRAARFVLAIVLIAALCVSLIWADKINAKFGLGKAEESESIANEGGGAQVTQIGDDLNVHFVDVGQGDACIIEFPDDRTMLIDAGDDIKEDKERLLAYIEDNIDDEQGNDITYFDFVILTHPDKDHCGGMYDVLTKYPAKTFYRPNVYSEYKDDDPNDDFKDPATEILAQTNNNKNNIKTTLAYDRAIRAAYEGKVNGVATTVHITDATQESIGSITPEGLAKTDPDYYSFTFYAPVEKSFSDWNDYSPIMILEYHGKRFMLSGDSEKEGEASFVHLAQEREGKYAIFTDDFTVDVFKLGHHGSNTSSSEAFIEVMTTAAYRPNVIAVISCGAGNSYHHPRKEVIQRLFDMGFSESNILCTAGTLSDPDAQENGFTGERGSILISVRGDAATGEYKLYVGESARENVTPQKEGFALSWQIIVIIGCIAVVIVLLVLPELPHMAGRRG